MAIFEVTLDFRKNLFIHFLKIEHRVNTTRSHRLPLTVRAINLSLTKQEDPLINIGINAVQPIVEVLNYQSEERCSVTANRRRAAGILERKRLPSDW